MISIPLATKKLDRGFKPLAQIYREAKGASSSGGGANRLRLALEREGGKISVFETAIGSGDDVRTLVLAERLAKFFLWSRGGWRMYVSAPDPVARHLARHYSQEGARAFDVGFMEKVYGKSFEVVPLGPSDFPAEKTVEDSMGGNLDGCRIGFDLGASDYKLAAVREGEVVFSGEYPWNPRDQADPDYHYRHLREGLLRAAGHLPRVDAIGGSTAGVVVNNQFRVASLLRSIPNDRLAEAQNVFRRLQAEWNVPLEVANDGDVTALAGAMSLGVRGLLGLAMGSSEAAGYIDRSGKMAGWLNELAFAPIDVGPEAPVDEWSGDRGGGALYFSQQAVNRLLGEAGIEVEEKASLPERLKVVQDLMAGGDRSARSIYETIGDYLGHALPLYATFYPIDHVLLLGRVTTGPGGSIILEQGRAVLRQVYPELNERLQLHLPDEKNRRVGQAVAAASLPRLGEFAST